MSIFFIALLPVKLLQSYYKIFKTQLFYIPLTIFVGIDVPFVDIDNSTQV